MGLSEGLHSRDYLREVITMRRYAWRVAVIGLGLFLVAGCWNPFSSGKNGGNGHEVRYDRTTPDKLLNFFSQAYEDQDIDKYDESLDLAFHFQFTQEVADSLGLPPDQPWWGKVEDLASTGNMFDNPEVTSIAMDMIRRIPWYACTDSITDLDGLCSVIEPDIKVTVERAGESEPTTYWVNNSRLDVMVIQDRNDSDLWTILRIEEYLKNPTP
jgi:hypothetical protein